MVTKFAFPVLSIAVLGVMTIGVAEAENAPIVFGKTQTTQTVQETQPSNATVAQTGDVRTDRIIFRYPGSDGPPAETLPAAPAAQPAPFQQMAALQPSDAYQLTAPSAASRPVQSESFELDSAEVRITSLAPQTAAPSPAPRNMAPLRISKIVATEGAELNEERGLVGMYPDGFDGKPTANGEVFKADAMTAAHPSLPLPSLVQLMNERTGQEIVVRVNDRGPFMANRIMDVSPRAARALGIGPSTPATLRVRYLGPAPVQMKEEAEPQQVAMRPSLEPKPVLTPSNPVATQPSAIDTPAPAIEAAAAMPSGSLFIQAGSFADIGNAQRLTERLGRGLPVKIEAARVNGGDYFRVMIGPFGTKSAAESVRDRLERSGTVNGFVVKR